MKLHTGILKFWQGDRCSSEDSNLVNNRMDTRKVIQVININNSEKLKKFCLSMDSLQKVTKNFSFLDFESESNK